MVPTTPRLGLAVTTIGRPALQELLESAARSSLRPVAVAIADQSGRALALRTSHLPFPVTVVRSEGGASAGRNAAAAALGRSVDVLAFPNDDSAYPPISLQRIVECFADDAGLAGVACAYEQEGGVRFLLPPAGTPLDRRTVWRAVEATTVVSRACFEAVGGFRTDLGTGSSGPWGSGEGTDLLLRVLAAGGRVAARPDIVVVGPAERRDLPSSALLAKHRAYARGTGYVYRLHGYPVGQRVRVLVGPLVKALAHDPSPRLSLRLAATRFLGRFEGLRGVPLSRDVVPWRPPAPD